MTGSEGILGGRPHHIGYSVDDLRETIDHWARAFGVGPWFVVENAVPEEAVHDGKPAVFEHSTAFASFGGAYLELHEIHNAAPDPVADLLRPRPGCFVNHVAYFSETPAEESARLEALGMPMVLHLKTGPVVEWLHASPFGHAIEIHTPSEWMDAFWAEVDEATRTWDGVDPLRLLTPP